MRRKRAYIVLRVDVIIVENDWAVIFGHLQKTTRCTFALTFLFCLHSPSNFLIQKLFFLYFFKIFQTQKERRKKSNKSVLIQMRKPNLRKTLKPQTYLRKIP